MFTVKKPGRKKEYYSVYKQGFGKNGLFRMIE